jgi:perosamine synthetase
MTTGRRIPIAGPSITEREIGYVSEAAATAWFDQANVFPDRFERSCEEYLGIEHAIALPSCTSAIHLSLAALGVGPGDEVILPDVTWIASSAPISYVGATPVFADIDPVTWCVDVGSVERALTSRTRAVIAVDLYGSMPDMDALLDVLKAHGVPLIEDAAEAIGSRYNGQLAGSFGLTGTFSFHGSKTVTTGEGGLLVTDDDRICARVKKLRDHGRDPGDRMFFNDEIGFKYKMSALQAALGLAQIERVEELVARKRQIFSWYRERLGGRSGIALNHDSELMRSSFWMVTVIVSPDCGHTKETLMAGLDLHAIDSRPFFHPLSAIPAYRDHPSTVGAAERNPVAYALSPYGINLPSGLQLDEEQVGFVCEKLIEVLERRPPKSKKVG